MPCYPPTCTAFNISQQTPQFYIVSSTHRSGIRKDLYRWNGATRTASGDKGGLLDICPFVHSPACHMLLQSTAATAVYSIWYSLPFVDTSNRKGNHSARSTQKTRHQEHANATVISPLERQHSRTTPAARTRMPKPW